MQCKFEKSKNLIRAYAIFMAYSNDENALNTELQKAFFNPEEAKEAILNMIAAEGSNPEPPASSYTPPTKQIDTVGNEFSTNIDADNMGACYNNSAMYTQVQIAFQKKMLAASILKIGDTVAEMEYIDPENTVDNIINYKNELIRAISKATNIELDQIFKSDSNDMYTEKVNAALHAFSDAYSKDNNNDLKSGEAFDAYMILRNFDALLRQHISYISIDPSFKEGREGVNKYSFKPTVKHRKNFSKDELSDITKQVGNLAETILRVIPDIDSNGIQLGSSIGVSGFNGAMQTLKRAVSFSNVLGPTVAPKFRKSIQGGAQSLLDSNNKYNLSAMIDAFIDTQTQGTSTRGEYRQVFLHNKLRGIQEYLLSDKTPTYIQNMFVQLFLKTEDTNYRAYSYNSDSERFEGKELRSRMYAIQTYAFEDIIKSGLERVSSQTQITANELRAKYDIKVHSDKGFEKIYIKNIETEKSMTITYGIGNIQYAKVDTNTPEIVNEFFLDSYGYYIPDTYETCIASTSGYNWANDFAPYIAVIAKEALRVRNEKNIGAYLGIVVNGNINLKPLKDNGITIGQRLGTIFGDSIRSTIRGLNGNSLPLYGLTSLEYNWRKILDDILERNLGTAGSFNLFAATDSNDNSVNDEMLTGVYVRNQIELNGTIKDPTALNVNEAVRLGMLDDFWFPSRETSGENNSIYLQNATFSDKSRHFLLGYKLDHKFGGTLIRGYIKDIYHKEMSLRDMINEVIENKNSNKFNEFTRRIRRDKYTTAALEVLKGFSKAMPELGDFDYQELTRITDPDDKAVAVVKALQSIDYTLANSSLSIKDIRARFAKAGTTFTEETFATKPKAKGIGNVRINETMISYCNAASSKDNWKAFIGKCQDKFTKNISKLALSGLDTGSGHQIKALLEDDNLTKVLGKDHLDYYNPSTQVYRMVSKDGKLHPIALAYFASDILLSQEYNSLTTGEIWAHANKNKDIYSKDTNDKENHYEEYSEANRLVNQIKRSVIYGSTTHPFAQGIINDNGNKCGVTEDIDIAIIEDPKAWVYTINGVGLNEDDKIDPQDGSGWCTALQSHLENNSLVDAAVGDNKKTILHSIDQRTLTPTLLKWAVYSLTNSVRRNGFNSNFNTENLVRRMYSKEVDAQMDLARVYSDYISKNDLIYIYNPLTCSYRKLVGIENIGNNIFKQIFEDGEGKKVEVNTLYDVDQLFGGCWTFKKVGENQYEGTETSVDLLTDVAIRYDQRDKQIAYAVNASACKVGATNLNTADKWTNGKLSSYRISTKYGGVMMNADHELDEAEVTEMSQMISALIEDGHYTDQVTDIYRYIGDIAIGNAKIKKSIDAVNALQNAKTDDERAIAKNKIREIVGRSLIDSFKTGKKDTIGLAQAFCTIADRRAKDAQISIPFDSATIWGAVIADVTSSLTKQGIRRKHSGFAGVLNPSSDMIMYYQGKDGAKLFKEFNEECKAELEQFYPSWDYDDIEYISWVDIASSTQYFEDNKGKTFLNPFWKTVNSSQVDFEDTVMVYDPNGKFIKQIYINNFEKYDEIRNLRKYDQYTLYINTAIPRNLRGTDTTFNVISDQGDIIENISLYNIDSVRASQYLGGDWNTLLSDPEKLAVVQAVVGNFDVVEVNKDAKKRDTLIKSWVEICNNTTQSFLEKLDGGVERTRKQDLGEILDWEDEACIFTGQRSFGQTVGNSFHVTSYTTRPAEIITGRYQLEKLGLTNQDHIADIKDWTYFQSRLKDRYNFSKILSVSYNVYDKVLFHNGKPVFVKVKGSKSDIVEGLVKSTLVEFNKEGDDLRIGSEVVISNEREEEGFDDKFIFEQVDTPSGSYTYITVDSDESLEKLSDSEYFDDIFYDPKNEQREDFSSKIDKLAKERFNSFKHALELVGARIPTQAMQSFMPFKIIAFSDSEQNVVYVPKANTHIEGSDYDIDKIYLLAASIRDNGKMSAGSSIQNEVGFETAIRLARPDGRVFKEGDSTFGLTLGMLAKIGIDSTTSKRVHLDSEAAQENFVRVFNKLYNGTIIGEETDSKGNTHNIIGVSFDENVPKDLRKKVLDLLNKHSKTPSYIRDSDEALRAKMFNGIYDITRRAQNQCKAQVTVDTCTGDLKKRAANTASGNAEKLVTPYDPTSKYTMQEQNMLGKAVVGIGAVSLKTYFILSTANNRKVSEAVRAIKEGRYSEVQNIVNSLKIYRPTLKGTKLLTTIANTNLDSLIKHVERHQDIKGFSQILDDLNEMKRNTINISTPEFLSGIISLAADNAKDLALPKLNATADLVDIYTTAAMIGVPFNEIADIMTSPLFNWMTEAGAQNIFDETTIHLKVKDMIEFARVTDEFSIWKQWDLKRVLREYNKWRKEAKTEDIYPEAVFFKLSELKNCVKNPKIIEGVIAAFEDQTIRERVIYEDKILKDSSGNPIRDKDGNFQYEIEKDSNGNPVLDENGKEKRVQEISTRKFRGIIPMAPIRPSSKDDIDLLSDEELKNQGKAWDQKDYYRMYQGFLRYRERLQFFEGAKEQTRIDNYSKLKYLSQLVKGVEEMSTLGRRGSINQGLKTDIGDFYNSTRNIPDFINDRLAKAEIKEEFNMDYFISDEEYRNTWFKIFNQDLLSDDPKIFTMFNIVESLYLSPNFWNMSCIEPIAEKMLLEVSSIYRISSTIADKLKKEKSIRKKLSDNDFRALANYITDLNIYRFLIDSDIEIDLQTVAGGRKLDLYEVPNKTSKSSRKILTLKSAQDIASFKHIMEEFVFPQLRANPKYKENIFLRSLNVRENKKVNTSTLMLPIQMMDADNDISTANQYSKYLQAFTEIANDEFAGLRVGDWFFIYNLIANKEGFGQHSLTRIFEDVIKGKNVPPTITAYYHEWLGSSKSTIDVNKVLTEAQEYINRNSRGTKIDAPEGVERPILPKDFTLYLPITANLNNTTIKTGQSNLVSWRPIHSLQVSEILNEIAISLNKKREGTITIVDNDSNLVSQNKELQGKRGFVYKGKIYINRDLFTDVADATGVAFHEVAHIVLASLKQRNPEHYYKLLYSIRGESDYEEIASRYERSVGSDLDEEVLCNKIEKLLTGYVNTNSDVELRLLDGELLLDSLQNIFPDETITFSDAIAGENLECLVETFAYSMFDMVGDIEKDYITNSQKIAAIKARLYDSIDEKNDLVQEC